MNKNKGFKCFQMISSVVFLIFSFMFLNIGLKVAYCEGVNPAKELISWTVEQNIGFTGLYDVKQKEWNGGAYWNIFKSKHDWLRAGLVATCTDNIGLDISFNVGKLIEKIKGEPLVYLKHLEVGYFYCWNLNGEKSKTGILINAIKIKF